MTRDCEENSNGGDTQDFDVDAAHDDDDAQPCSNGSNIKCWRHGTVHGTVMRLVILQGTARSPGPYVDGFCVSDSWTANDNSFDVIGTMLDNGG